MRVSQQAFGVCLKLHKPSHSFGSVDHKASSPCCVWSERCLGFLPRHPNCAGLCVDLVLVLRDSIHWCHKGLEQQGLKEGGNRAHKCSGLILVHLYFQERLEEESVSV